MKNSEQLTDEIWNVAKNIDKAKAPDFLLESIMDKIEEETDIVPVHKIKWIAIAASIIIGINIIAISTDNKSNTKDESSSNQQENVLSNYDLYKN